MHKNKKSEASIALIVAAVIGLIIIVILIFMVSGKLGAFVKGKEAARTCAGACNAVGMNGFAAISREDCGSRLKSGRLMPGDYPAEGIDGQNKVCCCYNCPGCH